MSSSTEETGNKLVLIGDSGVGKTCIISRFIKGTFDPNSPSNGASYVSKTIEIPELNQELALDIWDTAGQEKYRAITKFFFQNAKLVILVYEITRRESFDNMKNCWYPLIKEHADPDIVIGIAGNKSDLYLEEDVPEKEAKDFAKSIGAVFKLTSAQNNSGIDDLFKELGIKFLDPNSEKISSNTPKTEQKNEKKKEKESKRNIKINKKDVDKKNKEQKKKKNNC